VMESEQRYPGGDAAAADKDPWAISDAHEQNRTRRSGGRHRAKRLSHLSSCPSSGGRASAKPSRKRSERSTER
jgi:hypothetical protein